MAVATIVARRSIWSKEDITATYATTKCVSIVWHLFLKSQKKESLNMPEDLELKLKVPVMLNVKNVAAVSFNLH